MKMKPLKRADNAFPSTARSPYKVGPSFQNSPNQSGKYSNASTRLSERSSSTKKVFIPRSHKLDTFFNQSRPVSTQKLITSPLEQYLPDFPGASNHPRAKPERIQFLNFNLNKDYFDDQLDVGARDPFRKQFDRSGTDANNCNYTTFKKDNIYGMNTDRTPRKDKLTKIIHLKSEGDIGARRMKNPKILVPPVQRVMSKNVKNLHKMASAKSLEYTFGLP